MLNYLKKINIFEKIIIIISALSLFLPQPSAAFITIPTVLCLIALILILSTVRKKSENTIIKYAFYSLEIISNLLALLYVYLLVGTFLEVFYKIELWGGEFRWGYQFLFFPYIAIAILFISAILGTLIGFTVGSVKFKGKITWRIIAFLPLLAIGTVIFYIYFVKSGGGYPLFDFFISAIKWSVIVSVLVLVFILTLALAKKNYGYALLSAFAILIIAISVGANLGINKASTLKSCSDSDGGKNFYVAGEVNSTYKDINNNSVYKDRCYDSTNGINDWSTGYIVREFYCGDYGKIEYEDYTCSGYCFNGACIDGADKSKGFSCVDSDEGSGMCQISATVSSRCDMTKKGNVQIFFGDKFLGEVEDYCLDDNTVMEYSCHNFDSRSHYIDARDIKCKYGCSDGACLLGF